MPFDMAVSDDTVPIPIACLFSSSRLLISYLIISYNQNVFNGGTERDRTAVRGFADLCLTTRPRRHLLNLF
jgi:hypothetical protein